MREKILRGGLAVVLRQFLSLPVNALGVIAASRLLQPSDYGVQAIILPVTAFGMLIADMGTSQALIQSKSYLSRSVVQRLQLLKAACAICAIVLLAALSPWPIRAFGLDNVSPLLFPACGLLGWLQSERAYRSTILQRAVEWQALARIEMIEIVVHNVVLVAFAYVTRSAWCFVIALTIRNLVGIVLLQVNTSAAGSHESEEGTSIASLLRFGIPWQVTIMFSLVLNSANPIIVGNRLGLSAVGMINWSGTMLVLPQLPFQPLPSFLFSVLSARKRQEKDDRTIASDVAYAGMVLICFASLVIILILEPLVQFVFGNQWSAAIPAASILLVSNASFCPSLIIAAQLNSSGHSRAWMLLTVLKTILIWGLAAAGTAIWGMEGYAVAYVVASLLTLVAESFATRALTGDHVTWIGPFHMAVLMSLALLASHSVRGMVPGGQLIQVLVNLLAGLSAFAGMLWVTSQPSLRRVYATGELLVPDGLPHLGRLLRRPYAGR